MVSTNYPDGGVWMELTEDLEDAIIRLIALRFLAN